jgi:hypothetical protein
MVKKRYLLLVALLALPVVAWAGTQFTQVNGSRTSGEVDFSSGDSAPLDSTSYQQAPTPLDGRRTVFVAPIGSQGATCKVGIALGTVDLNGNWYPRAFVKTGTIAFDSSLTLSTATVWTGAYVGSGVELPTGGWTHFKVHCTDIQVGSVKVFWSAY